VGYFLFKCSIEWAQCHAERRKVRVARIDFFSAWIISLAAITLYVGQAISRSQFADLLQDVKNRGAFAVGAYTGFVLPLAIPVLIDTIRRRDFWLGNLLRTALFTLAPTIAVFAGWVYLLATGLRLSFALLGLLALGIPVITLLNWDLLLRVLKRARLPRN
jgi:hypothetical protein